MLIRLDRMWDRRHCPDADAVVVEKLWWWVWVLQLSVVWMRCLVWRRATMVGAGSTLSGCFDG